VQLIVSFVVVSLMICTCFSVPDKYFTGVTCFLLFNICAMCGSLLAAVFEMVMTLHKIFHSFLTIITLVTLKFEVSLSSNRQHYHIDDCLEDNREDY